MAANAMSRASLYALREAIAKIEGKPHAGLVTGACAPALKTADGGSEPQWPSDDKAGLEALFPEGLPSSGLLEIRGSALVDAAAISGFGLAFASLAVARPEQAGLRKRLMWIGEPMVARESGRPYANGLRDFGIDPARIVYAAPRRLPEALWLADTALESRAFAAVLMEIKGNPRGFGLTESRRLSLKARDTGCLFLLLRQGGNEEAGSTLARLRLEPMPAAERLLPNGMPLRGSLGNPVFRLVPEKSRVPMPTGLTLEWNVHEQLFHAVTDAGTKPFGHVHDGPAHPVAPFSASRHRPAGPQALGAVLAFERAS